MSLEKLIGEIQSIAPGTTVWTVGDSAHQATWSDHNPNAAGVVCAADVLNDAGLDLDWLANTITTTNPPALKYVIWQDRIWIDGSWNSYNGTYHTHVHVSVGVGPDGRSTGPYDDQSSWLATTALIEENNLKLFKIVNDDTIWVSDGMRRRVLRSWPLVELVYGVNPQIVEVGNTGELDDAAGPVDAVISVPTPTTVPSFTTVSGTFNGTVG